MAGYGIVASMKDFYWDIRPKPEYGTIEIRICDTPLTVELAAQLAAYAQTLAARPARNREREPRRAAIRVYGYNRFQACRFGFEGELVDAATGRARPIADDLRETLHLLAPHAQMLDSQDAFAALTGNDRPGQPCDVAALRLRGNGNAAGRRPPASRAVGGVGVGRRVNADHAPLFAAGARPDARDPGRALRHVALRWCSP